MCGGMLAYARGPARCGLDESLNTHRRSRTVKVHERGDPMRTLIQGGWVVGYDGRGHELIPNGAVVFEDNRVLHVGRGFEGAVDRVIDAREKLVAPGFVNCHLHAAVNAGQTVFIADGKPDYFGSNFIGYVAPRRGAQAPRTIAKPDIGGRDRMWSAVRARAA